jgi:hypothetical protein
VVESVEGAEAEADTWYVVYTPSGMTDPHRVVLRDNRGDRMGIRVSGMTGDVMLEDVR